MNRNNPRESNNSPLILVLIAERPTACMGRNTPSEAELVRRAVAGEHGAFEQLVLLHRPRVLRTAYGIIGSTQEAEDVAQEVFVKIWQSLDRFGMQSSLASWIYRITTNTAIDRLRRRRDTVSLDAPGPASPALESPKALPEDLAMRNDQQKMLRKAIMELSPNARVALILREYEQLSYKEIAEVLDIPVGTVMSRLNYARQSLRRKLDNSENL